MCGIIYLGGRKFEIFCEEVDPYWWRHPGPPIDLTQIRLNDEGPGPVPDPWRVELTSLGGMLAAAGHFKDAEHADRLGSVIAEVGNNIAEQAQAEIRFEWTTHAS